MYPIGGEDASSKTGEWLENWWITEQLSVFWLNRTHLLSITHAVPATTTENVCCEKGCFAKGHWKFTERMKWPLLLFADGECLQRAVEGKAASDEEEEDRGMGEEGQCSLSEVKKHVSPLHGCGKGLAYTQCTYTTAVHKLFSYCECHMSCFFFFYF